jgi:hypothetical protein
MAADEDNGRLVRRVDVNRDGQADAWEFYELFDDQGARILDPLLIRRGLYHERKLVERHLDTNFDGRIDVVRHYDPWQEIERELVDTDFDGRLDYTNHYRNRTLVERHMDRNGDGFSEEVRFYRGGNLYRLERDTTGDRFREYHAYYQNNELTHYGIDRNRNQQIDEWVRRQSERSARLPALGGPPTGTSSSPPAFTMPGEGGDAPTEPESPAPQGGDAAPTGGPAEEQAPAPESPEPASDESEAGQPVEAQDEQGADEGEPLN